MLVLDPTRRNPLRLPLEQVDLEHELAVDRVDLVERDDGLEEVTVVVLHVLGH